KKFEFEKVEGWEGRSRFLSEGDVVWEVGEVYEEFGLKLEGGWAGFNESTGYLVVTAPVGVLVVLEFLHRPLEKPEMIETLWEFFRVKTEKRRFVAWGKEFEKVEKEEVVAMEMMARSGKTVSQEVGGEELEVGIEIQPTVGIDFPRSCELRAVLDVNLGEEVVTANWGQTIGLGKGQLLELGRIGGWSVVLRLLMETKNSGGILLRDWHLREVENQQTSGEMWPWFRRLDLGTDCERWVAVWRVPQNLMIYFVNWQVGEKIISPFFLAEGELDRRLREELKEVSGELIPEEVRWGGVRSWRCAKEALGQAGVGWREEEQARYCLEREFLMVRSRVERLEKVEAVLRERMGKVPNQFRIMVDIVEEESEERELLARRVMMVRSGETAVGEIEDGEEKLEVKALPIMGDGGEVAYLQLWVKYVGEESYELNTGLTYRAGKPQRVLLKEEGVYLDLEIVRVDEQGRPMEGWGR
ncbi:MAG: hypothetical protein AAGC74_12040, partial [Verrucomicrobiota bacterium]